MTEFNTKLHDGVTELYFEEEGEIGIEKSETAILEYSDGTTEEVSLEENTGTDIETNIHVPSDTRVYIPDGVETEVYDTDTDDLTKIYPRDNSGIPNVDDPNEKKIYDPNEDNSSPKTNPENSTSVPDPDFSTPTDSKETLKRNYDWMFEKALNEGYEPVEAAEAANSMVQTFSEIDSMLE